MKQCKAKSKRTGKRCKAYVVKGMEVCYYHGGKVGSTKARNARRKAALRHGFYTKENIAERKELAAFMRDAKAMMKEI